MFFIQLIKLQIYKNSQCEWSLPVWPEVHADSEKKHVATMPLYIGSIAALSQGLFHLKKGGRRELGDLKCLVITFRVTVLS